MIKESVMKAYYFAKQKHAGQVRKNTTLEYFIHPKNVARIVEQLTNDEFLVVAALLHDVIEDTHTSYDAIAMEFGYDVADIVVELTNSAEERGDLSKKEYMLRKMGDMDEDVLLIKLADRLNNVQYLDWDATTEEAVRFLHYYASSTKYILDNLMVERRNNGRDPGSLREESAYLILEIRRHLHRINTNFHVFPESLLTDYPQCGSLIKTAGQGIPRL